jgi:hypothetical protein
MEFRDFNGQVHGSQNLFGNVFGPEECDQAELGLALGTNNLKPESFSQEFSPRDVPRLAGGLVQSGGLRWRGSGRDNLAAQSRVRGEHAEIAGEMALWRRDKSREPGDEGERFKNDRRGAIRNHRAIHMIGSVKFIMHR